MEGEAMVYVAISITLALKHPGIDSLGRWILSILAWLLPPFSALSFVFIACLPYSGLKTLWSTGQASSLMLLLQLGTILLANAAWLDGTRSPFNNRAVGALAKVSLLCLPAYTALCLYSLGLRIQQFQQYKEQIVQRSGFGEKSYNNLIESIENAKKTTPKRSKSRLSVLLLLLLFPLFSFPGHP